MYVYISYEYKPMYAICMYVCISAMPLYVCMSV